MNVLSGRITAVQTHGSIALVDVEVAGQRLTATLAGAGDDIAGWPAGMAVKMLFKETEVALAKNLSGAISMRNRIPATVTAIERGQLLSKVTLEALGYPIASIITTRSTEALQLAVGDAVEALVKANEMTVVPETAA